MITIETESITNEHEALLSRVDEMVVVARELPLLTPSERSHRCDAVVAFVEDVLLPHAKAEERGLYNQVGRILGHPEATAPMVYDHLAVREWTARLAETDPANVDLMQELLYGLHALVLEHFRKEEELYVPLVERSADDRLTYDENDTALRHEP